jgi:hypothetical protein
MDLGEVGWGNVHWIDLAQDRDAVMNFLVPWNAGKLSSGVSSSAQVHGVS